jgi:hypothetical protein
VPELPRMVSLLVKKTAKRVEGHNNLVGNSFSLLSSIDSSYLKDLAVDIGVGVA